MHLTIFFGKGKFTSITVLNIDAGTATKIVVYYYGNVDVFIRYYSTLLYTVKLKRSSKWCYSNIYLNKQHLNKQRSNIKCPLI